MLARTDFQSFNYATPLSTDLVLLKEKGVRGSGSHKGMPCSLRPSISPATTQRYSLQPVDLQFILRSQELEIAEQSNFKPETLCGPFPLQLRPKAESNPAKFDPLKRLTKNFIAMRILVWGLPNYPFIALTPLSTEEKSMQCKSLERKNALFDQVIRIKEKVVPVKQRYFTGIRGYTGIYLQLLWRICQLENRTPRVSR
ncbi:hypothetical protein J6590_098967 [Homalodisca vitripennis]|nr:hypothetical protein J6590_098967 [Homalodisca vitripennis]